jgi:hypothetical protein
MSEQAAVLHFDTVKARISAAALICGEGNNLSYRNGVVAVNVARSAAAGRAAEGADGHVPIRSGRRRQTASERARRTVG